MSNLNSKLTLVIGLGLGALTLNSCGSNTTEKTTTATDSTTTTTKPAVDTTAAKKKSNIDFKFATTVANLPSPFEAVNDIASYQAAYKKELLNPYTAADGYVSTYKKAVNMGIYGMDLAYVNFYGQNQDMLHYFGTIQTLSKELNFDKVFNEYSDRFKNNSNNKDSVITIVDNVFDKTDAYLKKNDNYIVASHILAGALIETNYLSLHLLKDTKRTPDNAAFFNKVYTENLYIYHLINLYGEYTDKDSKDLLAQLKNYKASYDAMIKSDADLTPANIDKAIALIDGIRNNLVKK